MSRDGYVGEWAVAVEVGAGTSSRRRAQLSQRCMHGSGAVEGSRSPYKGGGARERREQQEKDASRAMALGCSGACCWSREAGGEGRPMHGGREGGGCGRDRADSRAAMAAVGLRVDAAQSQTTVARTVLHYYGVELRTHEDGWAGDSGGQSYKAEESRWQDRGEDQKRRGGWHAAAVRPFSRVGVAAVRDRVLSLSAVGCHSSTHLRPVTLCLAQCSVGQAAASLTVTASHSQAAVSV